MKNSFADTDADLQKAKMLIEIGRFEAALSHIKLALAKNPNCEMAHLLVGVIFFNKDNYKKAIEFGKKAVHLAPDNSLILSHLANFYLGAEKEKVAIELAKQSIELNAWNSHGYLILGASYFSKGEMQAAHKAIKECLEIDPNFTEARNLHSIILRSLGKDNESAQVSIGTIKHNAEDAMSHFELAFCFLKAVDLKSAEYHFKESLRLDPEKDSSKNGILACHKMKNPMVSFIMRARWWFFDRLNSTTFILTTVLLVLFGPLLVFIPSSEYQTLRNIISAGYTIFLLSCYVIFNIDFLSDAYIISHPLARVHLTLNEKVMSIALNIILFFTIVLLVCYFVSNVLGFMLFAKIISFMGFTLSMMHLVKKEIYKKILVWYLAGLVLFSVLTIDQYFHSYDLSSERSKSFYKMYCFISFYPYLLFITFVHESVNVSERKDKEMQEELNNRGQK